MGGFGSEPGRFEFPEGVAVDGHGDVWVTDLRSGRVQEFSETGTYIESIGSKGSGAGQFIQPADIAVGPGGNIWISDAGNNRVEEYTEAGNYVRQFGSAGSNAAQFVHPDGIAYVGDTGDGRVEMFNEQGAYLAQFGSKGSGAGQFSMGMGGGIAVDPAGNLLVTDDGDNRVEDWQPGPQPSLISSLGSLGTGNGQFLHAGGVAVDGRGNVWATDTSQNRIEELNEKGEFIAKFGAGGTGNGVFSDPTALALDAKGDIWVTDTGNNRIEELNEKGEQVRIVGSKGTGAGQFTSPEGIAIDSKGNVWVADRGDNRIEKFSETGTFVKAVGSGGEPLALAIGPADSVWVADSSAGHIQVFNEAGEQIRQVGTEGSTVGKLLHPGAIAVDRKGDAWVLDTGNGRVEEFNEKNEFVTQFGSKGASVGQFNLGRPVGIFRDAKGFIWTTNGGAAPLEKWSVSGPRTGVGLEISVDGTQIESTRMGCASETCSVTPPEWTLQSSAYSVGAHSLQVKATDGFGRTTTKTVAFELQKDTTKPSLEASGTLFEAPKGWVEQETYEVIGKADDAGSGVVEMKLKIDGTQAGIATQSCGAGGCSLSHAFSVNTSAYPGGSHEAELVAIDGSGNSQVRKWTINVDPEGKVSVAEVAQTLEAADETAESSVVAPTSEVLPAEQREGGDDPGLTISGTHVESTGVPDVTTMTTDPEAGFTIHSPEGETTITPVVAAGASSLSVTAGVAGVTANVGHEADSVIRPEYNGIQVFEAIRSAESPEQYSWTVHVGPHQHLHLVNPWQAEVSYEEGTTAFLISAEPAHDATGKSVPTSLSVEGNTLTLKVEFHGGGFVYPVVAGAGWETSYTAPVIVEGPEDETQIHEREEREHHELEEREREEREAEENGGAPPPPPPPSQVTEKMARRYAEFGPERDPDVAPAPLPPPGAATASAVRDFQIYRSSCGHSCDWWKAKLYNATFIRHTESAEWEHGTQVHAHVDQAFAFEAVIFDTTWNCGAVGPDFVRKGSGEHLIAFAHFTIEVPWAAPAGETMAPFENNFALQDWIYPNGYQEKHVMPWDGEPNGDLGCPTVARP